MPYRTCDHLKEDGIYCSSPALRDQRYCYFHLNARARRVQAAQARLHHEPHRFQLPVLDNMHAVQAAIQQVADALADDRITNRRAGLLLYALQQAAANLKTTPGWQGHRPQVEADEPLRALEVNPLRQQYGLPFDTDFDAPPDDAAAQIDATAALNLDARLSQTQQQSLARNPAAQVDSQPDTSPSPRFADLGYDGEHSPGNPQLPSPGHCAEKVLGNPQLPSVGHCAEKVLGSPQLPSVGHCAEKAPTPGHCAEKLLGNPQLPSPGHCAEKAPTPGHCAEKLLGNPQLPSVGHCAEKAPTPGHCAETVLGSPQLPSVGHCGTVLAAAAQSPAPADLAANAA